jgi:hypothetical protein
MGGLIRRREEGYSRYLDQRPAYQKAMAIAGPAAKRPTA